MSESVLRDVVFQCLVDLSTEQGIYASGKDEVYGCIFGRDSAITVLKILRAIKKKSAFTKTEQSTLYEMCRKTLITLVDLQGKTVNLESGEEPGKFIHEYREINYDRLIKRQNPWYLYPDGKLRNYDSVDSTPLALIALFKYFDQTKDGTFLLHILPAVEKGLNWILSYGDKDHDMLIEYEFHKDRKYGGLLVQSWTDSHESIRQTDGSMPVYPIAPVEVQGYAWLALKLWSDFYQDNAVLAGNTKRFAQLLSARAQKMKNMFHAYFLFCETYSGNIHFPAQALDGNKKQLRTITGNQLLLLWSTYKKNGKVESILEDMYISDLVKRVLMPDMFDPEAGIRTMSKLSPTFNPNQDSYHNGSFWPKLNGMCHEGLEHWGFTDLAEQLKNATLHAMRYFGTPIELYIKKDNMFLEYRNHSGQTGCRQQAWSAAVALDLLT